LAAYIGTRGPDVSLPAEGCRSQAPALERKLARNGRKEKKMAEQQVLATGHADMDYAEHEKTYRLFLNLMKWGAIHCIVILIILAFLTL
jgi:hypothetical protein